MFNRYFLQPHVTFREYLVFIRDGEGGGRKITVQRPYWLLGTGEAQDVHLHCHTAPELRLRDAWRPDLFSTNHKVLRSILFLWQELATQLSRVKQSTRFKSWLHSWDESYRLPSDTCQHMYVVFRWWLFGLNVRARLHLPVQSSGAVWKSRWTSSAPRP